MSTVLDGARLAAALRAALRAHGEAPSWILVGHSLGGWYAEEFASRYPQEVAAVVLLDASHPEQDARLDRATRRALRAYRLVMAVMPAMARLGVLDVLEWPATEYRGMPTPAYRVFSRYLASRPHQRTALAELRAFPTLAATSSRPPVAVPHVVVIAADTMTAYGRSWFALQHERTRHVRDVHYKVWSHVSHIDLVADARVAECTARLIRDVGVLGTATRVDGYAMTGSLTLTPHGGPGSPAREAGR